MLLNPVPITETEMLVSWARAEIPSARFRHTNPPHLAKLEAGADLDAMETAEIVAFMRRERGAQVEFFLDGRTTWYRGELPSQALGALTLDAYWIGTSLGCGTEPAWREPYPPTVAALAAHPDAPPLTIEGDFDFDKVRGVIIAVSATVDGPLQLIEGSNRSRGMWRAFSEGKPHPATIAVILGVHPEEENYKDREAWLAMARIGWRNGGEALVARDVDAARAFVVVCPTTAKATAISERAFNFLRQIGVQERVAKGA